MARPRLSESTRKVLLQEGVAAFLTHGYHGTGLKMVLDRSHIPKGSFYNYFPSKEEFAVAAIEYYADCFASKMNQSITASSDPFLGLHNFFTQLMEDFKTANYSGGCLIANLGGEVENSEPIRAALRKAFRAWRDQVSEVLEQGQIQCRVRKDIPAEQLADLLVESWEGAVIHMKLERCVKPLQQCINRLLDDYFLA